MNKAKFVIWSDETDQFLTNRITDDWDESGYRDMYEDGEDICVDLNNFHKNSLFNSKNEAQEGLKKYLKKYPEMKECDDFHCIEITTVEVRKIVTEMKKHEKLNA